MFSLHVPWKWKLHCSLHMPPNKRWFKNWVIDGVSVKKTHRKQPARKGESRMHGQLNRSLLGPSRPADLVHSTQGSPVRVCVHYYRACDGGGSRLLLLLCSITMTRHIHIFLNSTEVIKCWSLWFYSQLLTCSVACNECSRLISFFFETFISARCFFSTGSSVLKRI